MLWKRVHGDHDIKKKKKTPNEKVRNEMRPRYRLYLHVYDHEKRE